MANGHEEGLKNQDQYVETMSGILVTPSRPYSNDVRIFVTASGHHHYDAGKKGEKENTKDLFFLKNVNTKERLSLYKIHVVPFLEVDVEEMMNRWVNQRRVRANPKEYFFVHKIVELLRVTTEQQHELDSMEQIIMMRENLKPYCFSEDGFKYLNKNDIEDIGAYNPYSIIDELDMGLSYLNSKGEKMVMNLIKIVKFCDATLERVLKKIKLKTFETEFWKKAPLLLETTIHELHDQGDPLSKLTHDGANLLDKPEVLSSKLEDEKESKIEDKTELVEMSTSSPWEQVDNPLESSTKTDDKDQHQVDNNDIPETESQKTSTDSEIVKDDDNVARESEADTVKGFDLNQEVCSEEVVNPVNPVSSTISVISASQPSAASGLSSTPLQFE
nr:IIS transcription factor [Tanacetum cinerariifolium]